MTLETVPSLLSGLTALGLGVFVWSRAPRRVANRAFAWGMAGLAGMEFARTMLLVEPAERAMWLRVALGAEALMLPGWALFSVAFARSDPGAELLRWRWPLTATGGLALAALATVAAVPVTLPGSLFQVEVLPLAGTGKAVVIFALLSAVFILFQLESTLRRSRGEARWQIKYFILGVFGIFAFHIFLLSNTLLATAVSPGYLPAQSATMLLAFGLIGFCLVRHRILEVNIFVSRHVVYHSLTVATVGAYLLLVGLAGWVMELLEITLNVFLVSLVIFATAMALLIGLLSETVRRRVKGEIARHFYQNKYDYRREWTEFTRKLASVVSPEVISSRVVGMVAEAMGIRRAALFLAEEGGGYRMADSVGGPVGQLSLDASRVLEAAGLEGKPVSLEPRDAGDPAAAALASLRAQGLMLTVPLVAKEEVLGFLAVGPPTDSALTQEDRELLETIAAQAAAALLNARLGEQLAQARELEALNRVASFMLHDLKNCVAMLSLVAQNAERVGPDLAFRRDAFRTVAQSVRTMQELINRLSHLPKSLELRLAPTDLSGLVREAVDRARRAAGEQIRFSTELEPAPPITADGEQVRKVLDNLLINAVEALDGEGWVRVRTLRRPDAVALEVSDTGPGIPEAILRTGLFTPFRTTKPHGLGIGLFQVKAIVQAHGGQIGVESGPGKGTTVSIEFPAGAENQREPDRKERNHGTPQPPRR